MYSENNRRYAARRADEDFLRRMMGGELSGNALPTMTPSPSGTVRPVRDARNPISCDGSARKSTCPGVGSDGSKCESDSFAPSLAMVYSPRQCWRGILEPTVGLSAGTIFSELALPLEAVPNHAQKEVRIRRPM